MSAPDVFARFPALPGLLDALTGAPADAVSKRASVYLFVGITLGNFSPTWSDIDIER